MIGAVYTVGICTGTSRNILIQIKWPSILSHSLNRWWVISCRIFRCASPFAWISSWTRLLNEQNEFGGPTNIIAAHLNDHHFSIRHSVVYRHRRHVHGEPHAITMHLTIKKSPSSDVCTVIHSRLSTRTQFHFSFASSSIKCICQRRRSVAMQLTRKTNKMCKTERSSTWSAICARQNNKPNINKWMIKWHHRYT